MKRMVVVMVLVLIAVSAVAETEFEISGTKDDVSAYLSAPGTVRLGSTGESEIEADSGTIFLVVGTEASTLQSAARLNNETRKRAIEILTQAGIDKDTIKTDKFSSIPQSGVYESKPKSNRVQNVLKVPFSNDAQIEAVAQVVDTFPEITWGGILFEHSKSEESKQAAREKAFADIARQKASYEKALGVRLRVKDIVNDPVVILRAWRSPVSPAMGGMTKNPSHDGQKVFSDWDMDLSLLQTLTYRAKVIVEYYVESAGK